MSSDQAASTEVKLPGRCAQHARLLSNVARRWVGASPASPRPRPWSRLLIASGPDLGRHLLVALRSGSGTPGAGARGPSDARPCAAGGVSRDRSAWEPNPDGWRLWGTSPGVGSRRTGQCFLGGPPAPRELTLPSCTPSRDSPLRACVVACGGGTEGGACRGPSLGGGGRK